jgi:hypothetical protein
MKCVNRNCESWINESVGCVHNDLDNTKCHCYISEKLTIEGLRAQFEEEMRKLNYDVSLCKNAYGDYYPIMNDKWQIYEMCARANNRIKCV